MRAGASSIPLTSGEMILLRLTSDPTCYWRGETEATTASEVGMGRFVMRPRMLATLLPFSLELAEDAQNSASVLQQAATNAMAVKMDQAILSGTGASGEPLGVLNTDNVNSQTGIGSLSSYDQIIVGIRQIMQSNYPGAVENLSWITGPEIAASFASLKTGLTNDHSPLPKPDWVMKLNQFVTTSLGAQATSPLTYQNLIGPFDQILVGFRNAGMTVQILDAGTAVDASGDSWNAVTQHLRFLRISLRMDFCVMQPTWFAKLDAIMA